MSDVLITYDIAEAKGEESKHTEVKDGMKALGYMQSFTTGKDKDLKTYYLPNTALWKDNTTPTTAKNDLIKVAKAKGANLERAIATVFDSWDGIEGKPYKTK